MVAGVSSKGVAYAAGGGNVGVVAITALRYAQSDGINVVMPVRPAQQIFANFRHIQLRPDSRLEEGIPLYKLRILDSLIDHLSRAETTGKEAAPGGAGAGIAPAGAETKRGGVTAASVDGAIKSLFERLRQGNIGGAAYRSAFLPQPGAFVDLVA
jgi:hypothetical protein